MKRGILCNECRMLLFLIFVSGFAINLEEMKLSQYLFLMLFYWRKIEQTKHFYVMRRNILNLKDLHANILCKHF